MAVRTKGAIKAFFETGDKPVEGEFSDLVDSYVQHPDGVGVVEVLSTALSTVRPSGAVGLQILSAAVTASAQGHLGAGAVGIEILEAGTTASAQGHLGAGVVGIEVFEAITTASAVGHLGIVTASETVFGIVEIATQAEMEAATATDRAVTAENLSDAMTLDTAIATTSGITHDFTGIRASAKRITVLLNGISTNGTSSIIIQIGDAVGFETTNYFGSGISLSNASSSGGANLTSGFILRPTPSVGTVFVGHVILTNISGNSWIASGVVGESDTPQVDMIGGVKELSDLLTQVRLTTTNGTDTFDAGAVNILVE